MSGITAIQALSPAETWEAWQALMQASLGEAEAVSSAELEAAQPHPQAPVTEMSQPLSSLNQAHQAHEVPPATAAVAEAQAAPDAPTVNSMPTAVASPDKPQGATPSPLHSGLLGDTPMAPTRFVEANAAVLPMAPVLMTPLTLQHGPELRWRVQDASSWRALFDDAGHDNKGGDDAQGDALPMSVLEAMTSEAVPPWAQALLVHLREAATAPVSAAALRPALQAWRLGLPVLLASPAGLASLQVTRDAATWQSRRWPARWRSARPAVAERWWAVRLALGPQGRPRTLRDLAGTARLAPGQVSCELRLDDVAPGIAQWADVLVQAAASPSLRALLAARPSLPWLLCNQPLWPQEAYS